MTKNLTVYFSLATITSAKSLNNISTYCIHKEKYKGGSGIQLLSQKIFPIDNINGLTIVCRNDSE